MWTFATWTCVTRLNEHTDAVTALAADANYLFSGSDDLTIRIWNLANMLEPYVAFALHVGENRLHLGVPVSDTV